MKNSNSQNIFENVPLLNQFVQKIWFEPQTPSIIQLVSSNADYMILCAAIVNDATNHTVLRSFTFVCRQKGIDIRLMREKLIPAANALGLTLKSSASQDYYHILGLTPAASADEIKKAFRQKARSVHPDTNRSGKSQSRAFVKLHEAYLTLSNPESRRCYDQKSLPAAGLWNEERFHNQRPPRKFGYIYMIGGLALFFITAAFIFDFIFREEVLSDIMYTDEQPPVSALKRAAPLDDKAKGLKPQAPAPLPVLKAPAAQNYSEGGKQKKAVKNIAKKFIAPLRHPSVPQTSDAMNRSRVSKFNPDNQKKDKKSSLTIGSIEYIDTAKNSDLLPKKEVLPPLPIENDHQTLSRSAKYSASSTLLPEKDRASMDIKDKIENFLKTYCTTYEQKKLKKFVSFFKLDAIENGKLFHTLLPQYRHNFATITSISYTIIMRQYSYLSDSTDIKMEGDFFVRWRENGANWKKNSGSIFMHLEQSKNSFLVKQLYYLGGLHDDIKIPSASQVSQNSLPALKKKVKKFLNAYCQTYANKNLAKFVSFFRSDATENGQPFHTLLPQYRHNFSMIDSMTYNIVIYRHSRLDAETVKIDGAFSVRWHQYNGNQSKNSGSISMVLGVENNSLRVKALNYRSD